MIRESRKENKKSKGKGKGEELSARQGYDQSRLLIYKTFPFTQPYVGPRDNSMLTNMVEMWKA